MVLNFHNFKRLSLGLGLASFLVIAPQQALAAQPSGSEGYYDYSYNFSFPGGSPNYTIDNWYILQTKYLSPTDYYYYGFRPQNQPVSSPAGGVVDTNYTVYGKATTALIFGLTQNLPGDGGDGQYHVVLGMDPTAASYAQTDWSTLFRSTSEDAIVYDLQNLVNPDQSITDAALQDLVNFAYGDASNGIVNEGQALPAWFDTNGSDPVGGFSIMSWSQGTLLGSGSVTATQVPAPPVPEPMSMLALGAGLLAFTRKRKKA